MLHCNKTMSGAKRGSSYRKGVVEQTMKSFPVPEAGEEVVRVVTMRGGNIVEIVDSSKREGLALLPTKFRRLIWIKRGDYLIVSSGGDDKVSFIVRSVLYPKQIKHLKDEKLWPFEEEEGEEEAEEIGTQDDELFVNTNHMRNRHEEDESSDDSD